MKPALPGGESRTIHHNGCRAALQIARPRRSRKNSRNRPRSGSSTETPPIRLHRSTNVGRHPRRHVARDNGKFTRSPFFTFVRSAHHNGRDVAGDLHAGDLRRRTPGRQFGFEQAVHAFDFREVGDRHGFAHPHRARHRIARAGFDARDGALGRRAEAIVAPSAHSCGRFQRRSRHRRRRSRAP